MPCLVWADLRCVPTCCVRFHRWFERGEFRCWVARAELRLNELLVKKKTEVSTPDMKTVKILQFQKNDCVVNR